MHTAWTPPRKWIFGAATLLGLFSTLQAYRLTTLNWSREATFFDLLILNLVYWYVPAALTPTFFRLGDYVHRKSSHWLRALAVHAATALSFSLVHVV